MCTGAAVTDRVSGLMLDHTYPTQSECRAVLYRVLAPRCWLAHSHVDRSWRRGEVRCLFYNGGSQIAHLMQGATAMAMGRVGPIETLPSPFSNPSLFDGMVYSPHLMQDDAVAECQR
jgi:hypothetical protein